MDFGLTTFPQLQNELAGTPRYMAPELFAGAAASVASEIYALGVLLFFLVSGEFPSQRRDAAAAPPDANGEEATALASTLPSLPSGKPPASLAVSRSIIDFRPDIPESFALIVEEAIQPDPAQRFSSAGALSTALSHLLAEPSAAEPPWLPRASGKRRRLAWIYAAAAMALLAGIFVSLPQGRALLGGVKGAASFGASASVNDEYQKADELLQRYDRHKNVSAAINLLNDVLAHDPRSALALADLGRANFLQYRMTRTPGQLDQARTACNRAIAIDSNLAPPYITLARIDAMAGKTPLATTEVEMALQLEPRSAEAYGAQAEVFAAEGRGDKAIESVQQAIALAPEDWRWPVLLGHYDFVGGKLAEAAEQFRKAVEVSPDNSIALLDLGLASMQSGRYDEAQSSLQNSAQYEPSYFAYSSLSEVLTAKGDFAGAVEMSKKALALDESNYVAWGNLASAYLWSRGGHDKAMESYRKAIELAEVARKETPQDATLLASLGGYYAAIGQSERSLPLLHQAVALAPDDPNVLFDAGDGLEILRHRDEAIRLIVKSIAKGFHANQLQMSPELAALRADSKFQEALRVENAKNLLDTGKEKR
jgi:tetratricopeptide (TPR) repeat protein